MNDQATNLNGMMEARRKRDTLGDSGFLIVGFAGVYFREQPSADRQHFTADDLLTAVVYASTRYPAIHRRANGDVMKYYNFLREMSWVAGASPAEWELFLDEVWVDADESDGLVDQADSKRFILVTLGICLLLAAPAVWAVLSLA